jgi:hypothetical protein
MPDTLTLPKPGPFKGPDGDNFLFDVLEGQKGKITFSLSTKNDITWWKGIKIFGDGTWNTIGLLETTDSDHGPARKTIDIAQFIPNASRLEFWKAKAFGVHTDMVHYVFDPTAFNGKTLSFVWQTD